MLFFLFPHELCALYHWDPTPRQATLLLVWLKQGLGKSRGCRARRDGRIPWGTIPRLTPHDTQAARAKEIWMPWKGARGGKPRGNAYT